MKKPLLVMALLALPLGARAEPLVLHTPDVCELKINGVRVTDAHVIGEREAMSRFLSNHAAVYMHSCSYLLSGSQLSQADYVLETATRPADPGRALGRHDVRVKFAKPEEFFAVLEASRPAEPTGAAGTAADGHSGMIPPPDSASPAIGGGGDAPPPNQPPPTAGGKPGSGGARGQECRLGGEVCLKTDGEVAASAECGPLSLSLSTSGSMTLGMGSGPASAGFTIGGR